MLEPLRKNGELDQAARAAFADDLERIAAEKCRESFSRLFAYYAPRLKTFIMRLGADDAEAEELAQDVMITVWRKAEQYDRSQASPSTWIFRIARNRRIDAFRRKKTLPEDSEEPALMPSDMPHPEDVFDAQQLESAVRSALSELPDEQRDLLKASFFEGLSHAELSERMGVPLGTVKSRIRLAFQKLRTRLNRDEL
ncbi:sigma-70 family RNA polymerase sigma factor [Ponticaulis profundi]|uniref:RNA polymerase sigma factor n=1 Tax=Ponticaulis profundi TaxID=2665222 RepID=A0ABW1SAA9_9PROT